MLRQQNATLLCRTNKKMSLLFNSLSENYLASSLISVYNELQIYALLLCKHSLPHTSSHHQTVGGPRLTADPQC